LLAVIVPRFAEMLVTAGIEPTFSTQFLIWLSAAVHKGWWLAPLLVAGALVAYHYAKRSEGGRRFLDQWLLKIPFIGRIALYSNLARMARTMSILMRGGVHILDTVNISARVLQNSVLRSALASVTPELRRGERLAKALSHTDFMPPYMLKMIAVGDETGNVESMLERVADRFEGDLRKMISRGLALLEPAVIIALGLVVGLIVITMFLAIMQLQGALG
jgi:type II secretory pathway component PulF